MLRYSKHTWVFRRAFCCPKRQINALGWATCSCVNKMSFSFAPPPLRVRGGETSPAVPSCLPGPAEESEESRRSPQAQRRKEGGTWQQGWDFLPPLRNCALERLGLGNPGGAAGAGGLGAVGGRSRGGPVGGAGAGAGPARLRGLRAACCAGRAPWTLRAQDAGRLRSPPQPLPPERARPGAAGGRGDVSRGPRARSDRCDVAQARGGAAEERPEALGDSEEQLLLHPAAAPRARRGGRPPHG